MVVKRAVLRRRLRAAPSVLLFAGIVLYAIWPWLPFGRRSRPPRAVVFYGFSILREAINDGVFPAFQREWRKQTGETIELVSSFAGSGTVTNQILLGVPAQVVLLSLELDAFKLRDAGVTKGETWRSLPSAGVVNRTPFIILVRPGNPKGIRDFEDLGRPGVRVVHPDPLTSGGANWAIAAEYGAGLRRGGPEAGFQVLLGVWRNVVAQASSARAARTQFENGFGDALITYEQEALWDRKRGKLRAEIVYPRSTILSEHTLVLLERNVAVADRPLVRSLVQYLWSEEAQKIFVRYGFRSVREEWNAPSAGFGRIEDPFRISDLGGWSAAKKSIVEAVWKERVLKAAAK